MDEDILSRLGSIENVWKRVRAGSSPPPPGIDEAAPEYGSFCILPDARRPCRAVRFIPEIK